MRREHIASPRSPPVRGLATDSGRRSGNQFYGGRSVQKGELEFKPMFNKKNIAKLLVFAMILTMLPVSVGANPTRTGNSVTSFNNNYVQVSDVKAVVDENMSYTLSLDSDKVPGNAGQPYVFEYDTAVDTAPKSVSIKVEKQGNNELCGVYAVAGDADISSKESIKGNDGVYSYTLTEDTKEYVMFCIATKATEQTEGTRDNEPTVVKTFVKVKVPQKSEAPTPPETDKSTYKITLDVDSISVEAEKTQSVTATVVYTVGKDATEHKATAGSVAWTIANTTYATMQDSNPTTVGANGTTTNTVNAKSAGATNLTVIYTAPDGNTTATLTNPIPVTVTAKKPATGEYSIMLDAAATVKAGEATDLTATVMDPDGNKIENPTLTWESSDEDVATVANGKVTGVAQGEANITATYVYGIGEDAKVTATCKVTVTDAETPVTGPYTITLDAVEVLAGGTAKVTANVEYTVDSDTQKATDGTVQWKITDSAYATVKDTTTDVSDGVTANTVTATDKTGSTTIELIYMKDGESLATKSVDLTVKPVDLSKLHLITSKITGGSVTYTQNVIEDKENNAYKAQEDVEVSFTLAPLDSTYKLYADSVNVYKVGNDTAEPLTDNKNNVYTFTMPDCDVIIMAVFTKASEDVDVTMDIDDLKVGYALPEPTAISLEGATVTVKWFGPDGEEVTGAFPTEGDYTYEFTVTLEDGTVLDNASVNYTVNGQPTESVRVGPKDERAAYWRYVETDNVAGGDLIIKGTSADKFYLIAETTTMSGVSVSAYVIVQGGAKGEIKVPCAGGSVVSIWETPDPNGSTEAEGVDQFVNEKSAENDLPGLPDEDSEETFSENRREGIERTGRITQSDVTWEYVEEDNVAGGNLIINNTSANRYYLIAETTTMSGVSVSAYVIVQGNDGTISVPCMGGSVVSIWETPDPNGSTETEGVDQFVNEKGAEEDLQGGT